MTVAMQHKARMIPESLQTNGDDAFEVCLRKGGSWHLDGDHRGQAVLCVRGSLWITEEMGGLDHKVDAGEIFVIHKEGRLVAQALEDAGLRLMAPLSARRG